MMGVEVRTKCQSMMRREVTDELNRASYALFLHQTLCCGLLSSCCIQACWVLEGRVSVLFLGCNKHVMML